MRKTVLLMASVALAVMLASGIALAETEPPPTEVVTDLALERSVSNDTPAVGEKVFQSFEVTNLGPDTTEECFWISDVSQGSLRTEEYLGLGINDTISGEISRPNVAGGCIVLASGESTTFSGGAVTPLEPGDITYTATVRLEGSAQVDPNLNNNTATATLTSAPTPDTTAPTVSTTSPGTNGTTTNKAVNVMATFSEDVKGVNGQTFYLKAVTMNKQGKETYVPVDATVTPANRIVGVGGQATLNPTKDLAKGTYQATITQGVTDKAGNALVPKTWSFKVSK